MQKRRLTISPQIHSFCKIASEKDRQVFRFHRGESVNEVLEIAIPGGSKWFDGRKPFSHPHVICMGCKKVIDLDVGSLKDITKKVADKTGFDILSYRLDFFGVCSDCKRIEKRKK